MAKKRKKKAKRKNPKAVVADGKSLKSVPAKDSEQLIKTLIEKGQKKGFLTYEEMNEDLPEDAVSAARLDSLLATLDERGISLLDEADVESQRAAKEQGGEFEASEVSSDTEETDKEQQFKDEDELLEKQLVGEDVARRIDDPIRMYLTQMGQIPLLTRNSEIALARKIEIARMAFRRKMLQCDYCA